MVLIGPTAIGKTALSLEIAERFQCEIISVDSMQVYRYMDIGTAKATLEERERVAHHLIDVVNPDEDYDAARFAADARRLVLEITARGNLPLLTGGTGLYLKAFLDGIFPDAPSDQTLRNKLKQRLSTEGCARLHNELSEIDPVSAKSIHANDTQRLLRALEVYHATGTPWSEHLRLHKSTEAGGFAGDSLQIGLTCDRQVLYERINYRCELMLEAGLEQEVKSLIEGGYSPKLKSMNSIGYRHMASYLAGEYDYGEMQRLLARDTRRYAKRQYTWFNKNDKVQWVEVDKGQEVLKMIEKWKKGLIRE